ncbi:MAG: hypothetical protein V2A62_01060 [Candidatus Woesearchaeota archaeon]
MVEDKVEKIQKVKIVGRLYQARQVVGLIKDIVLLIFIFILIAAGIVLATMASQIQLPF